MVVHAASLAGLPTYELQQGGARMCALRAGQAHKPRDDRGLTRAHYATCLCPGSEMLIYRTHQTVLTAA